MAFQFRFDSLLSLRARQRDDAGIEVSKALEAISRVDTQIAELQKQRNEIRLLASGMFVSKDGPKDGGMEGSVAHVSVDRVLQQGRYDLQLQAEQMSLRQTKETLARELQRRRDVLIAAEAEVKRLERLRETRKAEHEQTQLKREQDESDDLTIARMIIAKRRAT